MTTLIGARCKCSNAFSRGVLIPRQNSRKELWESRKHCFAMHVFSFLCRSSFSTGRSLDLKVVCWWFGEGETPVLIPNTAVKPFCADGSRKARVGRRQHRALNSFRQVIRQSKIAGGA